MPWIVALAAVPAGVTYLSSGLWWVLQWVFVVVGWVLYVYFFLMSLLNSSTLRATRETIETKHGPLPTPGIQDVEIDFPWPDADDATIQTRDVLFITTGERQIIEQS